MSAFRFICAPEAMVDLDEPVRQPYYDVKDDYLSVVPLTMFITSTFREVIWRPHETGACLIIDDPLLKTRYGFCDFLRWRDRMREHRFTTCIAFIPWNWRRTTRRASEFFKSESDWFSVSIHGCDHTAAEFGSSSVDLIDHRAHLAQTRMHEHQARTGIRHDPVMVFPRCLFVGLSRDLEGERVCGGRQHRDFARRRRPTHNPHSGRVGPGHSEVRLLRDLYATLSVPRVGELRLRSAARQTVLHRCDHESLRHGGASLLTLIDRLQALNCTLQWQSPGHIVRRAYRRRRVDGLEQVEMYANEIRIINAEDEICVSTFASARRCLAR